MSTQAVPDVTPPQTRCDVLVVGGGINGAAIARDLAGRGLQVVLCEKDDLAQHTSSSSTKLIHGGLRYLEHREFLLVRKALAEREVLLKSAPHIMWPLRFVMPHDDGMRPAWMIRLGLFLYDHLARREVLRDSRGVNLRKHAAGVPLKPRYTQGFVYSDGWVDDARLVVLNAVDAHERGAQVLTRWNCTRAERGSQHWEVTLQSGQGETTKVTARALVNAAGPWAAQFLNAHCVHGPQAAAPRKLRLVKGSHIVVQQRFTHDHAYIFQNPDQRIIFAIPYEQHFTLIGTTDVEHLGPPGDLRIDESEITYLCEQASRYFEKPVLPSDVVWHYSGVRPLLDEEGAGGSKSASQVTRDYALELTQDGAPLLSVWGGKITTCRKLAEESANLLAPLLGCNQGPWTHHNAPLPGGDLSAWIREAHRPDTDFSRFEQALAQKYPAQSRTLLHRLARAYGSRAAVILDEGLGAVVAGDLHEGELRYLHDHEWARSSDDVLWRRSKLGLHLSAQERQTVADWWAHRFPTVNRRSNDSN
jgi:glycerol-3-phosphate dehydrogenase